jgi:hypothetical protein
MPKASDNAELVHCPGFMGTEVLDFKINDWKFASFLTSSLNAEAV